jgi:hypothetical protein
MPYPYYEDGLDPVIYRYHSCNRPDVYFCGGKDNGENLFLGFELEFDTRDKNVGKRINKHCIIRKSNDTFGNATYLYYMMDGSLLNGLEMISQPATFEYHCQNRQNYETIFNEITARGFKSQSFQSCGLHFHFNRSYYSDNEDKYLTNLLYLVDKFWFDLLLFSRRKYSRIYRFASKYCESPKEIVARYKDPFMTHSRYKCVNLCNNDTIEFRIYKGTLNISDFFCAMELTRNMIVAAKEKTDEELKDMKFSDLLTTEELVKYSRKRHHKSVIKALPDIVKKEYNIPY